LTAPFRSSEFGVECGDDFFLCQSQIGRPGAGSKRHDSMRTIRFGLNYVPSKRWYYCWNDWDPSAIAEDFQAMSAIGVDHLRVMLIWPWFQPNPATVSEAHLRRLDELMDLGAAHGLDIFLCPLTGWLSGYSFLPPGIAGSDVFQSAAVFERIQGYFQAVLATAAAHGNFLGFDLGNELNVLAPALDPEAGNAWGDNLTGWLRPKMGGRWLVNGIDHRPWFAGQTFDFRHLVSAYDAVTIHAWPMFTSCLMRGGLADAPSVHLSAFLTRLCRHLLRNKGLNKLVWVQEFGCSGLWGSEVEQQVYMRGSVDHAVRAGATWFTWWCSHDIDRIYRFDPLEYDLGLFTADNHPKPLAHLYRDLIREYRDGAACGDNDFDFGGDFAPEVTRQLPPEQWLEQNLETTTWRVFERYLATR